MRLGTLALAGVLLASCSPSGGTGVTVTKRAGEPDVVGVADDDAEMDQAMAEARRTIDDFISRLESDDVGEARLSLKVRFEEDGKVEHIWLRDVRYRDGVFTGTIANNPLDLDGLRLGDRVTAGLDRVSDWMAVDGRRLVGGYTIRVIRDRQSAAERQAFDEETGLVFE